MSANAIERLWHGCTHYEYARDLQAEAEAKLAVEALLEGVKAICVEPTTAGPAHDQATRVISYRALREILEPLVRRVETGQ